MPEPNSFDYAVIRVVPRVDREEFVNAGVILFCLGRKFLSAQVHLDEARLTALCPDIAPETGSIRARLEAFVRVCAGDPTAGPIALLPIRQRFGCLTAPRSTVVQVSPVHSGLCEDPQATLDELFQRLVK